MPSNLFVFNYVCLVDLMYLIPKSFDILFYRLIKDSAMLCYRCLRADGDSSAPGPDRENQAGLDHQQAGQVCV